MSNRNNIPISQVQPGDILLYRGNAWLSRAIRFFDKSEHNHSAIYIGNGDIIEAVGQGVISIDLETSRENQEIYVRRLKERPQSMSPVLEVAKSYLGTRYAYEQMILCLLVVITRRQRVNRQLLRFVQGLIEGAMLILLKLSNGDRKALLCSELVYRSYNEAVQGGSNPYKIELLDRFGRNKGNRDFRYSFEKGSLLSKFYQDGEWATIQLQEKKQKTSVPTLSLERSMAQTEDLFETFINTKGESVTNADIESFGSCLKDFLELRYQGTGESKSKTTLTPLLDLFARENANFVSPGDLNKALNLETIGEIDFG